MRFGLFLILLLILSSCAQVGELSGGDEDYYAPIPDSSSIQPTNGALNYTGSTLEMRFNEFIQLNNPTETMVVIPPNIKPKVVSKGKKLLISWEEPLLPNTTYAFYLNGTVSDITEKNDSLYTFVFSTGNYLDSLTYSIPVNDAIDGSPKNKVLVGLWEKFSDSVKPLYIAQSNASGLASFQYLKEGRYEVVAFEDKNRNLLFDADEAFGFLNEPIVLNENKVDSIGIRLSPAQPFVGLTTTKFVAPSALIVAANNEFTSSDVSINGQPFEGSSIRFSSDSLLLFLTDLDSNVLNLRVKTAVFSDSDRVRITAKEKALKPKIETTFKDQWRTEDTLCVYQGSPILAVDQTKILALAYTTKDTVQLSELSMFVQDQQLFIPFPHTTADKIKLTFLPGAITSQNGANTDSVSFLFNYLMKKDLGTINVRTSGFPEPKMVEMISGGKPVLQMSSMGQNEFLFDRLLPKEYQFRILLDENGNGKWDGGNLDLKKQPEKYIYFNDLQKVRPNWDLELDLIYEGSARY